jgi:hypothetical protein
VQGDGVQEEDAAGPVAPPLAAALAAGDVAGALALLRTAQLVLPLTAEAAAGTTRPAWATTTAADRTWVLAATSMDALRTVTRGLATHGRLTSLPELAAGWPDPAWGLAVDPGLPTEVLLEPGTLARLAAPSLLDDVLADPAVPTPLVQQLLDADALGALLAGGEVRVSGYVHQLMDVAHVATPAVLVRALGRGADLDRHLDPAGSVWLLRWPAVGPELYRSPYGGTDDAGRDAVAGWVVEEPPFVGLGFAPDPDGVVREYRVEGVELPHGAQVWELDDAGDEHRRAVLDGDRRVWQVVVPAAVDR